MISVEGRSYTKRIQIKILTITIFQSIVQDISNNHTTPNIKTFLKNHFKETIFSIHNFKDLQLHNNKIQDLPCLYNKFKDQQRINSTRICKAPCDITKGNSSF